MKATQMLGASVMACVACAAGAVGWLQHHVPEVPGLPAQSGPNGTQCGQWCVLRSCELVGIPVTLERVISLLPSGPEGHSLSQLSGALRELGCDTDGVALPLESLEAGAGQPAIVHLSNPDHFMVVSSAQGDRVHGFDTLGQRSSGSREQLRGRWTGRVLRVTRASREIERRQGARIEFDSVLIDKGDVPATGERVVFTFGFTNAGATALVIDKATADCGCLECRAPTAPVAPGSRAEITATYDGALSSGSFAHDITVRSNDRNNPIVTLRACGFHYTGLSVRPRRLSFENAPQGHSHLTACFITAPAGQPFEVREAGCSIAGSKVDWYPVSDKQRSAKWWPESNGAFMAMQPGYVVELEVNAGTDHSPPAFGLLTIRTDLRGFERLEVPVVVR